MELAMIGLGRMGLNMATRLVRCFPAVVAMYGKVKARRRAVDQLDLLLGLRDLLRRDPAVRGEMQRRLDHVFVDEFQDTDPLQAEILLLLCASDPAVRNAFDVRVTPGKLFVVGDPKQSIYRFRRADVALFSSLRRGGLPREGEAAYPMECLDLTANFRSEPRLVEFCNALFSRVMAAPDADLDEVAFGASEAARDASAVPMSTSKMLPGRVL